MKSSFVQLIVKNRLAGKSIPLVLTPKKYQPLDSFKKYVWNVLPKIEEAVQVELLKKNLKKIESSLVRKELVTAYLRRLFRLRFYEEEQIKSYKELSEVSPQEIITFTDPTILKDINEHTEYDVGSYVLFSREDFNTLFKHKTFGNYLKEYQVSQKFSLMIRRQSVGITAVMRLLQQAGPVDWTYIAQLSPDQRLQFVQNETNYPVLFQEISNYIYAQVKHLKDQENYLRIWGSSVISDILVNSILQNINNFTDVFSIADQAIAKISELDVDPSANDFAQRFRELPTEPPLKIYRDVPYFCKFYYKTPSFKSIFLGGLGGTGKSMILAYAAMFAFKNKWITVSVTDGYRWTHDRKVKPVKMYNGLFLIEQHVLQWLDQFKTANQHILGQMKVNLDLYGKIDLTGVHQQEYEPVPNIYYPGRQTYFNDILQKYKERVQNEMDTRPKWRLTDLEKTPTTILDIINIGLKNPTYSTCAMGQALLQVYEGDQPVLEVVDDFSWLYKGSVYRSFKYYNDNDLFGRIPPYHLAHCRFFVNLDGHKIKKGLKLVASSIGDEYKHHFDIKKIMLPVEYEHRVPNLTPEQFQNAGRYNILTGYWQADQVLRKNIQYMYVLCQGNWKDFERALELGHYY